MAALEADAQMQPDAAHPQAILTARHALGKFEHGDRVQVGAGRHGCFSIRTGEDGCKRSQTWKVVPCSEGSKVIDPPGPSITIRRAVSSPSPVPAPTSLVVKNGSNTRARMSGGMPGPVSEMST